LISALGWLAACADDVPEMDRPRLSECLQKPNVVLSSPDYFLSDLYACVNVVGDLPCPSGDEKFPWSGGNPFQDCEGGQLACVVSGPSRFEDTVESPGTLDRCCYEVLWYSDGVVCGRPLRGEDGRPALAPTLPRTPGWCGPVAAGLPGAAAALWAREAAMEHASIASFARLALDLMAHGAPARLLEGVAAAMADEVRHAQAAYALASGADGAVGPGPLAVPTPAVPSLVELATATVRDGVVNESLAAAVAAARLASATDPAVVAALRAVVDDEARHAALAWQIVAWACEVGGAAVQAACDDELASALNRAAHAPVDDEPWLPAWGLCGAVAIARARRVAIAALRFADA